MKTRTDLFCLLLALAVCAPAAGESGNADHQSLVGPCPPEHAAGPAGTRQGARGLPGR